MTREQTSLLYRAVNTFHGRQMRIQHARIESTRMDRVSKSSQTCMSMSFLGIVSASRGDTIEIKSIIAQMTPSLFHVNVHRSADDSDKDDKMLSAFVFFSFNKS